MSWIESFVVWLVAPILLTVVIAVVLSILGAIFGFKPPDTSAHSWFKGRDW
jgi:hypothetical protein